MCLCWFKGHVPFKDLENSLLQEAIVAKPFLIGQEHAVSWCMGFNAPGEKWEIWQGQKKEEQIYS